MDWVELIYSRKFWLVLQKKIESFTKLILLSVPRRGPHYLQLKIEPPAPRCEIRATIIPRINFWDFCSLIGGGPRVRHQKISFIFSDPFEGNPRF